MVNLLRAASLTLVSMASEACLHLARGRGSTPGTSRLSRRPSGPALLSCAWILAALGAACSQGSSPGVAVRDSAGVRIAVSLAPPDPFAELDPEPYLSLGGAEARGPELLSGVQGIHLDPRGRVWVADGQSGELRIFRPDGTHWKTRGGSGGGPGEFVQIRLLGAGRADTVLVGDGGGDRVTVYDPEGELVRTVRMPAWERPPPRLFDAFPDGAVLGRVPRPLAADALEPGQVLGDSVELVRVALDSSAVRPAGGAAGPLWLWTGRSQVPIPFTGNAAFAVHGEEVHLASGPGFRVGVYRHGELREVYGVEESVRPVTEADRRAYLDFVEEYVPERMRAGYRSALEHPRLPSHLPGYDRVMVAADGRVWTRVFESELESAHDWHLFDERRRLLGRIRIPAGFRPMAATGESVVGVWRDSLGVEHVRGHRVRPVAGTEDGG